MMARTHPLVAILVEAYAKDVIVGSRVRNLCDVERGRIHREELILSVSHIDDTVLSLPQHAGVVLVARIR